MGVYSKGVISQRCSAVVFGLDRSSSKISAYVASAVSIDVLQGGNRANVSSGRAPPDRHLRQRVLVFAGRLPNHKGNVLPAHEFKLPSECPGNPRECRQRLSMFPPAAEPFVFLSVFLQPGVGGGDHKQSPRQHPRRDSLEEEERIVKAIDQVSGEDEIVAGKDRSEIAGVSLQKQNSAPHGAQAEGFQRHRAGNGEFPLGRHLVAHLAPLLQLHPRLDKPGGEIDRIDMGKTAGKFKG